MTEQLELEGADPDWTGKLPRPTTPGAWVWCSSVEAVLERFGAGATIAIVTDRERSVLRTIRRGRFPGTLWGRGLVVQELEVSIVRDVGAWVRREI